MSLLKYIGLALIILISGCASIVDGKSQSITIQSSPESANVSINGVVKGKTPITMDILRDENTVLKVSKEGYADVTQTLPTSLNSMFWGNIIFGGLPGSTTDTVTGASREYIPDVHMITLQEQ